MKNELHKRLFFAIPISNEIKNTCIEAQEGLPVDNKVKLVKPHNFHFTVLYLGNVLTEKIPELIEKAEKTIASSPTFTLEPEGVFLAPSKKPKMVWVKCPRNSIFSGLYKALKDELKDYFQTNEDRDPIPHITLARFKSGLEALPPPSPEFNVLEVKHIELWESKTLPTGAEYSSLHRFSLSSLKI
ncbi:MAG: RNA 2',3'-cyclic phosphodiesterase [Bacteroidetes bacterium]|nr:RNA 2',3'-cyclic phosphodiesterase [Bacteroidota bacterium]